MIPDGERRRRMWPYASNIAAFGVVVVAQQVLVLPLLMQRTGTQSFAAVAVFFTIYSIACSALGDELGNTYLARGKAYEARGRSDFFLILLLVVPTTFVAYFLVALLAFGLSAPLSVTCAIAVGLGVFRYSEMSVLRRTDRFGRLLIANCLWVAAAGVTLLLSDSAANPYLPFAIAEFVSLLATLLFSWNGVKVGVRLPAAQVEPARQMGTTVAIYAQLATMTLATSAAVYLDRLVVIPLLGYHAGSVYFAASAMSKATGNIVNPVASANLAKLSQVPDSERNWRLQRAVRRSLPLLVGLVPLNLAVSIAGVMILYPAVAVETWPILLPLAIASGLSSLVMLQKPIVIRFTKPTGFVVLSIVTVIALIVLGVPAARLWGLAGFAWAAVLARSLQLVVLTRLALRSVDAPQAKACQ